MLLITGVGIGSFGFEFEEAGKRYLNAYWPVAKSRRVLREGHGHIEVVLLEILTNLRMAIIRSHPRPSIRGFYENDGGQPRVTAPFHFETTPLAFRMWML